jgi:hypothetical protein
MNPQRRKTVAKESRNKAMIREIEEAVYAFVTFSLEHKKMKWPCTDKKSCAPCRMREAMWEITEKIEKLK